MVYPCGCDCLNELTLLLGQLVTDMGLDCILDLVVHDKVDRDVFILEKLNQLGRKDFVIFLNYTGDCDIFSLIRVTCKEYNCSKYCIIVAGR